MGRFLGFPDAETAPQLENFDGISSAGTWKLIVSDHGNVDVGTLNSWSVLITHPTYSCTPFVLTGVSISGRVLTSTGRGLPVRVTLTDAFGDSRSVQANRVGTYQFTDVPAPGTYVLTASWRLFLFSPQVVVVVTDDITGLNIVGVGAKIGLARKNGKPYFISRLLVLGPLFFFAIGGQ